MKITVETSARHIHLCESDISVLFGPHTKLTVRRPLSQPGQYACNERINLTGPRGSIQGVAVLGPPRERTQVELSLTDARNLGITAPIRESGDLENTPGCVLSGPAGTLTLKNGVIVAKRHVHLDPKTAKNWVLHNGQTVSVQVQTPQRSLVFEDVLIRVSEDFSPAFHIDTDEANAAGIPTTEPISGVIIA